jgi:uncharacterized glyoxalase superfamily protein PhnB
MKRNLLILVAFPVCAWTAAANDSTEKIAGIVAQIQHADYAGDQAAMQKGYDELTPFLENKQLASRIRYWRGFAQWRRAINGFNEKVDPKELVQQLNTALDEFKAAIELDPKFVDAKVGIISSLGFLLFADPQDEARKKERIAQILATEKEASTIAPDNPRLIWVRGPILWNSPPERGGGQDKAIQNYEHGLEICSKIKPNADSIEPSWGKPELTMSLAYAYLNKKSPDLKAAEHYARSALEIVPYWRYTRDILLPQILKKKDTPMTNRSAPDSRVVPILIYSDLDEAILWLSRAFGFEERLRAERQGVVVHAQLTFGEGAIILGRQGKPFSLSRQGEVNTSVDVTVDDVNTHFERAKRNGAHIIESPTDKPFGERQYTAEDFAGHRWTFSQHIADVSPESWGGKVKDKNSK